MEKEKRLVKKALICGLSCTLFVLVLMVLESVLQNDQDEYQYLYALILAVLANANVNLLRCVLNI